MADVKTNIVNAHKRIREAALRVKRGPESIRLVAVTKEATEAGMRQAIAAGISDIGENRVREALLKHKIFGDAGLRWHMIGHLQSNKAKDAVKLFSLIHSVDSIKLARAIDKEASKIGKVQDILAEVNVSGEEAKFGMKPEDAGDFLREASSLKNINTLGLMTMAPFVDDAEKARPYFRKLKELADSLGLKELSMGMTQDFEVAVEEGATMVRVGSAIFKGEG
jgi:pyridoxal phosphate enzyme (YggS family)